VARKLNKMGYEATALEGGFDAWKAQYPTETPQTEAVGQGYLDPWPETKYRGGSQTAHKPH
jgi:hypothetical protein